MPSSPGPSAAVRLVLWLAAAVAVMVAGATVVVLVLGRETDEAEVVRAPDAPADLCAVIGTADLAAWVPGAEWEATTDGNRLNTEATCTVDTENGQTADLAYGSLSARVYRYGSIGDGDRADEQAVETIEDYCAGAAEGSAGLGDDSCVAYAEESAGTGRAAVEVRRGADLVTVTYYANPLTADEARARAVDAASRVVAVLDR